MLIIPLWRDTRKLLTWVMFSQGATGWLPGGLGGTRTICTSAGGKGAVGLELWTWLGGLASTKGPTQTQHSALR